MNTANSESLNSFVFDCINAEVTTVFMHRFCPVIIYKDVITDLYWGEIPVCMLRHESGHGNIQVVGPCTDSEGVANLAKGYLLAESLENINVVSLLEIDESLNNYRDCE